MLFCVLFLPIRAHSPLLEKNKNTVQLILPNDTTIPPKKNILLSLSYTKLTVKE